MNPCPGLVLLPCNQMGYRIVCILDLETFFYYMILICFTYTSLRYINGM
jgi:hypothetical protein